jgi:hypothetical protein
MRPEKYIFNRVWFEESGGRPEFDEFSKEFRKLSVTDKAELMHLLSFSRPSQFLSLLNKTDNSKVKDILPWYKPLTDTQEAKIWRSMKKTPKRTFEEKPIVPVEELVEDAGLEEAEPA